MFDSYSIGDTLCIYYTIQTVSIL